MNELAEGVETQPHEELESVSEYLRSLDKPREREDWWQVERIETLTYEFGKPAERQDWGEKVGMGGLSAALSYEREHGMQDNVKGLSSDKERAELIIRASGERIGGELAGMLNTPEGKNRVRLADQVVGQLVTMYREGKFERGILGLSKLTGTKRFKREKKRMYRLGQEGLTAGHLTSKIFLDRENRLRDRWARYCEKTIDSQLTDLQLHNIARNLQADLRRISYAREIAQKYQSTGQFPKAKLNPAQLEYGTFNKLDWYGYQEKAQDIFDNGMKQGWDKTSSST